MTVERPGRPAPPVTPCSRSCSAPHYGGLCRLATLLLGDAAAAEEVVQEAFLRTFSSWWRLRQPERAQFYVRRPS